MPDDTDDTTTSALVRWEHTNDVIGSLYLCVFVLFVGLDAYTALFSLATVPRGVRAVWLAIAGIAAAWMFGEAAVRAWRGS
jgi:hypothetical protein